MSTSRKLTVEIVTGERVVYEEEDVDLVLAPGAEGEIGILPRHAPLFSLLAAGELLVRKGTEEQSLAVFGGFLEVVNDRILILADTAERLEEIDVERAEEARRRAEEALQQRGSGDADISQTLAALRRARVRTQVARRRRRRSDTRAPGSG